MVNLVPTTLLGWSEKNAQREQKKSCGASRNKTLASQRSEKLYF